MKTIIFGYNKNEVKRYLEQMALQQEEALNRLRAERDSLVQKNLEIKQGIEEMTRESQDACGDQLIDLSYERLTRAHASLSKLEEEDAELMARKEMKLREKLTESSLKIDQEIQVIKDSIKRELEQINGLIISQNTTNAHSPAKKTSDSGKVEGKRESSFKLIKLPITADGLSLFEPKRAAPSVANEGEAVKLPPSPEESPVLTSSEAEAEAEVEVEAEEPAEATAMSELRVEIESVKATDFLALSPYWSSVPVPRREEPQDGDDPMERQEPPLPIDSEPVKSLTQEDVVELEERQRQETAAATESLSQPPQPTVARSGGTSQSSERIQAKIELTRYKYIIGKLAGEDMSDHSGNLIIRKGDEITPDIIEQAQKTNQLSDLIINMTLPGMEP